MCVCESVPVSELENRELSHPKHIHTAKESRRHRAWWHMHGRGGRRQEEEEARAQTRKDENDGERPRAHHRQANRAVHNHHSHSEPMTMHQRGRTT